MKNITITIPLTEATYVLAYARSAAPNAAAAVRFYAVDGDEASAEEWRHKKNAWRQIIADIEEALTVDAEQRELHSLSDIQF